MEGNPTPERRREFKVEIAEPIDVDGIRSLLKETWLTTYPNSEHKVTKEDIEQFISNRFTDDDKLVRLKRLGFPDDNSRTLVVKSENKIVGYAAASRNDQFGRLRAIYVNENYQGKGVGAALWKDLGDFFDSHLDVVVDVVTYNERAKAFYKKQGFEDTGKRWSDEKYRMKSGSILPEMEMVKRAKRTKN